MTSTSIYTSAIPVSQSKTKIFISKATLIHGDLYNYDLVEYIHSQIKVKIICKVHGIFEQTPSNHLAEKGCISCGSIRRGQLQMDTSKDFIIKATNKHSDLYNYDYVEYINSITKVKIECKFHGIFKQTPMHHIGGNGCPICGGNIKLSLDVKKAQHNAHSSKRRASKLKATPKWAELDLIKQLYIDCQLISEMTCILHHVDHIVPLKSDIVHGLHCIANLQIITAIENLSKLNYYWPDMP